MKFPNDIWVYSIQSSDQHTFQKTFCSCHCLNLIGSSVDPMQLLDTILYWQRVKKKYRLRTGSVFNYRLGSGSRFNYRLCIGSGFKIIIYRLRTGSVFNYRLGSGSVFNYRLGSSSEFNYRLGNGSDSN